MTDYLGNPISGGGSGGTDNHFDLINIGQNTHVELDDFKTDIESKVNQNVSTTASPSFANVTTGAVQCTSVQTNTVQSGSIIGTNVSATNFTSGTVTATGQITGQQLDINDNVFSNLNFKKQGNLYWNVYNSGPNGDSLIFQNVNNDQSIAMSLTQDSQLRLGEDNSYLFPLNIGTAGQVLMSDGASNLEFKAPTTGRYVQASTQSIVNISGTTVETIFAPSPNQAGVGQFRIDGDTSSANLDTYVLCIKGQVFTDGKERVVIRLTNAFSNVLFTHDFEMEDIKSNLPGEPFVYNLAISRFLQVGNTDSLRIDGCIEYNIENGNPERNQVNSTVGVGSPNAIDLTMSWQFPDDTNTQVSITSVIFQRIF
jgi:hypothetical protein